MKKPIKNNKDSKGEEERKVPKEVMERYLKRLTFLKNGKEYFRQDDFVSATKSYQTYLGILAEYKGVKEKKLNPTLFNDATELAEMLLVSHTYWDLAKIYDRTPSLRKEFDWALMQFVRFTEGFKYQHPNTGMLKRWVRKKRMVNYSAYQAALTQLAPNERSCYLATYCYGQDHFVLTRLRAYREKISSNFLGKKFIKIYYYTSPLMLTFCWHHPKIGKWMESYIFRPFIKLFLYFIP